MRGDRGFGPGIAHTPHYRLKFLDSSIECEGARGCPRGPAGQWQKRKNTAEGRSDAPGAVRRRWIRAIRSGANRSLMALENLPPLLQGRGRYCPNEWPAECS